jgi:hypothetical protein
MLFAEATPDPESFWQLMLGINFLVSLGAGAVAIWSRTHVQRREVTLTREYATRDELLRIENELAELRAEMKQDRLLLSSSAEARHEKTQGRIDALISAAGKLQNSIRAR